MKRAIKACEIMFLRILYSKGKMRTSVISNVEKILIPGYMGLGDAVYFVPTIKALKDKFPEATLTMLWDKMSAAREFIELTGLVDSWVYYERNQRNFFIWLQINLLIRKNRFDLYMGRQSVQHAIFAFGISNIRYRIGHVLENGAAESVILNFPVYVGNEKKIPQNLKLLEPLGLRWEELSWQAPIRINDESRTKVREFLKIKTDAMQEYLVAFHMGCSEIQKWKNWGVESYSRLAAHLLSWDANLKIIVLGGKLDEADVDTVMKSCDDKRILSAVNIFSLRETIALLSLCDACVMNDSGLRAISYSLNLPTVVLFGPTNPEILCHGSNEKIIRSGLKCSPCFGNRDFLTQYNAESCVKSNLDIRLCLKAVSPEYVFSIIKEIKQKGVGND